MSFVTEEWHWDICQIPNEAVKAVLLMLKTLTNKFCSGYETIVLEKNIVALQCKNYKKGENVLIICMQ